MINSENEMSRETIMQIASTACVQVLQALGLTSGEMSANQAKKVYGKDFLDFVKDGRLQPCRVGDGKTGTKWYAVADILALKAENAAQAMIVKKAVKN